jgi:hypothetical protein
MAKTNYGHVKRQKEAARKLRQQKKQDRRQSKVGEEAAPAESDGGVEAPVTPTESEPSK